MNENTDQQIIPGISLSKSGQATVEPALTEVLIELAIRIDDQSKHPVDVEHVLAAIVLAAMDGKMSTESHLSLDDESMISNLSEYVTTVFEQFGGKVGTDD